MAQNKIRSEDIEPNIEPFSWYIEAFNELSTCRTGLDITPIPFTAIYEYAKIYELDDFDDFLYIIRLIDNFIISKEKAKKDGPK